MSILFRIYYVVPENIKDIDHTEIDFKDKKSMFKQFEFAINGNGTMSKQYPVILNSEMCVCKHIHKSVL